MINDLAHSLSGYSAHANPQALIDFFTGIPTPTREERLRQVLPQTEVVIP